ncbi:hypothetical protein [Cardinium endosymbiont of Philonthus spinipes]|uniref:hypothetical protein n=1 Tax=Cardinium endosymbiont of Philonthus spinipes TaxID=3077941 RepID=UPI00313CBE59
MSKNVYYLGFGLVLGAILGVLVCDDTKKRVTKTIQNKAKQFSGCVQSSSKKAEEAIDAVKSTVKDYLH